MIVTKNPNVVFVHVRKTGGKSITRTIQDMHGVYGGRVENYGGDLWRVNEVLPKVGLHPHAPASVIKRAVGAEFWEASFRLGIIRRPLSWLASWYKYIHRAYYWHPFTTFESFVRWAVSGAENKWGYRFDEEMRAVALTQSSYFDAEMSVVIPFDHMETALNDFVFPLLWGIKAKEVCHLNKSPRQPKHKMFLSDEVIRLALDYYREDNELFESSSKTFRRDIVEHAA